MPASIDRNDVDISNLFKWSTKALIVNDTGEIVVDFWIRLLGDADLNRARVYALRKSAELRKLLHNDDSDESLAYIPQQEFIPRDRLMELYVLQLTREFAQMAVRELQFNLPTEPRSDATLAEQESYQSLVDEWPTRREDAIKDFIMAKMEQVKLEIANYTDDEVYKAYKLNLINTLCEDEMMKSYREICVYYGSYTDETFTTKYFKSLEEVQNLAPNVKSQVLAMYFALELDGEELKKSPEAMQ